MRKAYINSVTEFEAGWGSRPDGYVICFDKEVGQAWGTKHNGHIWGNYDEFSTLDGEWKLCILTEKGEKELTSREEGVIWFNKANLSELVEEY